MVPLALALSLFMAGQPVVADPPLTDPVAADPPAVVEDRLPAGAPREDYPFVAWCYGTLRGYLDLHDEVMPEVTRIESEFRKPGTRLADDLKVYADMETEGHAQLKLYKAALTAAEKASLKPINVAGAKAVQRGKSVWNAGPQVTKAQMAQAWMSWVLPDRCAVAAHRLETSARLMGTAFKVNAEPEPDAPPAPPATPAPN
jgi:hypothetical protein